MEKMNVVKIDDQMGSRGRDVRLVLETADGLIPFHGESLAPYARVLGMKYTQNGKWSHSTWTVELFQGAALHKVIQDFEAGSFVVTRTWDGALKELGEVFTQSSAENIRAWVVQSLPKIAARLDAEALEWAMGDGAAQALANQAVVKAAYDQLRTVAAECDEFIVAQEAVAEAERISAQAAGLGAKLAQAKGGKLSLADLKASLAG